MLHWSIMFGKRPDGKKIKLKNAVARMTPMFLGRRTESINYFLFQHPCEKLDEYIVQKNIEGANYSYRDIIIACLVRIFATRPKFNRFFIKDTLYQRNHIDVSMMVHKDLRKGDDEVIVKIRFTGLETIAEVKEKIDTEIQKAIKTEQTDKSFNWMPQPLLKFIVRWLRFWDRFGLLTDRFLKKQSPFHTSIFYSDLKSIRLNYAFHHLFNFGNCGFFCTLGKEHLRPIVDEETHKIEAKKIFELGISVDDRVVDGLYYSHMIKGVHRITADLTQLEQPLHEDEIHIPRDIKVKKMKKVK